MKGYRIVARRYRTKLGEIDLIARKGDLVAFVEVKARRGRQAAIDAVSHAAQAVSAQQATCGFRARATAPELSLRYDIVAVLPWRWPAHFPDAF